jgi:hypothetical protein
MKAVSMAVLGLGGFRVLWCSMAPMVSTHFFMGLLTGSVHTAIWAVYNEATQTHHWSITFGLSQHFQHSNTNTAASCRVDMWNEVAYRNVCPGWLPMVHCWLSAKLAVSALKRNLLGVSCTIMHEHATAGMGASRLRY